MIAEQMLDVDVAIIGSGAGGGTAARELAPLCAEGLRVAVFEEGGRFRPRDNTRRELEMVRRYYVGGGAVQTASGDMTLAFCRAVGGGTNVYTGVTFRLPEQVLGKWAVPGLDAADLAPRFERYCADNGVHLHAPEEINRNNRLFADGCRRLGWEPRQFPVNTRGCAGLNTCNLGCPRQAKQGTAQVQIPMAEAAGVHVYPFCRIDHIEPGGLEGRVLPPAHGLDPGPLRPGPLRVRARAIVLAAGTMQTPPLLMRSFPDWERRWPALGRFLTCHPALTLVAQHDEPVEGSLGHPKSYYCDAFARDERFLLETCFYFPFATSKNLAGYGPELDELMRRMDRQQQILVLTLDAAHPWNRVREDEDGQPVAQYHLDDAVYAALAGGMRAAARVFFAGGATRVHLPGSGRFFITAADVPRLDRLVTAERVRASGVMLSAAHLMGGCRMGSCPEHSVTDARGRVHGLSGVYVADASLFPASAEVNPYLTIMALAGRTAETVGADLRAATGTAA
ncbi:MAG TPA: GMC family oxidoreductase N-terminal domain-containing protein [Gammaproteobacteria bacterium]|nr:GMC family oxidoreductase N-terminal domain-containing protein [Gammaproteobacteria bacterium]